MLSSKGAACKVTARIGLRSKSDCGVCYKLNRQRTVILESSRIGWSLKAKGTMAYLRMVPDPAVLRAAEDLCAEAAVALRLYRTKAS
jgi:hypothetical protein